MAKKKMGAPEIKINWELVEDLLGIQCTKVEVCDILKISDDTISRRCKSEFGLTYAEYSDQKGSKGRVSLRRKQYELAMSGDRVMLIWLGKQYLKQSDKQELTHDFKNGLADRLASARKRRAK
jgi:hypothetical protein